MDATNLQSSDVSGLQVAIAERQSEMTQISKAGMPVVIPDPDLRFIDG